MNVRLPRVKVLVSSAGMCLPALTACVPDFTIVVPDAASDAGAGGGGRPEPPEFDAPSDRDPADCETTCLPRPNGQRCNSPADCASGACLDTCQPWAFRIGGT